MEKKKNAKIFLVDQQKKLKPMRETEDLTENDLQTFLANYPDLLPGDQINPEAPRRWLLVAREIGVPDKEDGSGRWSADHLFLDQDGIPTFVECKRSTNTQIRREIVAQLLEYAANGTQYWPIDRLRQVATETAKEKYSSLDEAMSNLLEIIEIDEDGQSNANDVRQSKIENYWKLVEDNLKAGRVRLLFVADQIPGELRRLVEFLNEKMDGIEVLAVEVKRFSGDSDQTVLVPRVIGVTETTRGKSEPKDKKPVLTRETFLASSPIEAKDFFNQVLDKAEKKGHIIEWGTAFFWVRVILKSGKIATFAYCTPGDRGFPIQFQFYFAQLRLDKKEALKLREDLMAFKVFKESSSGKTLKAYLNDAETLPKLSAVYDFILEKIDEIKEKY